MWLIDFWKWMRENDKKPLTEGKTRDWKRGGDVNLSPTFPKPSAQSSLPDLQPERFFRECASFHDAIEPMYNNKTKEEKRDRIVKRIEWLEERVKFLSEASMEPRQIKLEIEFSKIQDLMTSVVQQTHEHNKKIEELIKNNNYLVPKIEEILKQLPYSCIDVYELNERFNELVVSLVEEGIISIPEDIETVRH